MGDGSLSQLTYWHVRWVIPAALVRAALELGGDAEVGLRLIAERGEPWMRSLALELLYDKEELRRILEDLREGAATDTELVEIIKRSVKRRE